MYFPKFIKTCLHAISNPLSNNDKSISMQHAQCILNSDDAKLYIIAPNVKLMLTDRVIDSPKTTPKK